jgi:hypothetical protein
MDQKKKVKEKYFVSTNYRENNYKNFKKPLMTKIWFTTLMLTTVFKY